MLCQGLRNADRIDIISHSPDVIRRDDAHLEKLIIVVALIGARHDRPGGAGPAFDQGALYTRTTLVGAVHLCRRSRLGPWGGLAARRARFEIDSHGPYGTGGRLV